MLVVVLFAFRSAGLADVRAECANLRSVNAAARHEARCETADGCAVHIVADARGRHANVFFGEAGGAAMVASIRAGIAGVETGLMLLMCHESNSKK